MDTKIPEPSRFIEHAGGVASYFGFRPLRQVNPELFKKHVGRSLPTFSSAANLCAHCVKPRDTEPVLAYYASPCVTQSPHAPSLRNLGEFSLHITGAGHSLGEVIVIKTAAAILHEWGTPLSRVRINTFGDRDSRERFNRELALFVRRRFAGHEEGVSEEERAHLLSSPSSIYNSKSGIVHAALCDAPRPVHFLSERSRTHFKEILEQLEHIDLPYELDDTLGGDEREPRVVFLFDTEGDSASGKLYGGVGGRYDDYVSRLSGRRENSTVHASIFFAKEGMTRSAFSDFSATTPKLYFIQLGLRAKLRGLSVIDTLRRAHMPVAQSFDTNHLGTQLAAAQRLSVPFVLIMGEREARDGTVIVRRLCDSSQTIVGIGDLHKRLRALRI